MHIYQAKYSCLCYNLYIYIYDKGDYESLNEELLNKSWMVLFQDLNISAMWEVFQLYLMDKCTLSVNLSAAKVRSYLLWLNK